MKKWLKRFLGILLVLCLAGGAALAVGGYRMYAQALKQQGLEEKAAQIREDPDYTSVSGLPDTYLTAVVAAEDHRFWEHKGVDPIATLRAAWNDLRTLSLREGGSTITQQLAKNLYFTQEKRFVRKIAEMFMAVRMERTFTKEEILELYVNTIYFGSGYYGVAEAAGGYFGKEPGEMNEYECTLLAGIPNAPSVYTPMENPDLAEQRRQYVLGQMKKYGQ